MKHIILIFSFLLAQTWSAHAANPSSEADSFEFPTHAQFMALKENQKRDFLIALQNFYVKLSKNPTFRATAKMDPSIMRMLLNLSVDNAEAQNAQRPEPATIAAERAQITSDSNNANKRVTEAQAKVNELTQKIKDLNTEYTIVSISNPDIPPTQEDLQRYKVLPNEISAAERALTQAKNDLRQAEANREAVKQSNTQRLTDLGRRAAAASLVESSEGKFICIYAGFAINGEKCQPKNQIKLKLKKEDANATTIACKSTSQALCNPLLFGLNNGKEICVSRGPDATAKCQEIATKKAESVDAGLDSAIALANANPAEYDRMVQMYSGVCQGKDQNAIETFLKAGHPNVSSKADLADIAKTCIYFKERYSQILERRKKTNGPSTGKR